MITSLWTITYDPDGGLPLTLASVGDRLDKPPPMGGEQEVETVPIIESLADHYPRDHRWSGWTLEVTQEHATLIAAEAFRETRLAAIPWSSVKPLQVISTALSVSRRMADAVIQSASIDLTTRGRPRTVSRYVILGKPFANYTP